MDLLSILIGAAIGFLAGKWVDYDHDMPDSDNEEINIKLKNGKN